MKTALEAQISGERTADNKIHVSSHKSEGSGTYGANRGILHPIYATIIAKTADEAIRLYRMGYLSTDTLKEAGILLDDLPPYGSVEYNQMQLKAIDKAIEQHFGYTHQALTSKCRKRPMVLARHISMYLLCTYTTFPLTYIGAIYGGRDHTTALHARNKIISYLTTKGYSEAKNTINEFLSTYCFEHD